MGNISKIRAGLREKISQILVEIRSELSADVLTFFLYDRQTEQFDLPVGDGLYDRQTFEHPSMMPRRGRAARKIVQEKKAVFAPDAEIDPEMRGAFIFREEIKSSAGCPLISRENVFGVLFISYRQKKSFDLRMRKQIKKIVGKHAQRLYDQIDFDIIRGEGFFITETAEDDGTYQKLADLICDRMDRPAAVWRLDPEKHELRMVASRGIPPEYAQNERANLGDGGIISQAIEYGELRFEHEITTNDNAHFRNILKKSNFKSSITHPIHVRGQALGLIELFLFNENKFIEDVFGRPERNALHHLSKVAGLIFELELSSDESKWLADMTQAISNSFDFNQVASDIVQAARKITFAHSSAINFLGDKSKIFGLLDTHACLNDGDCHLCREDVLSQYIVGQGSQLVINDLEDVAEIKDDKIGELVRNGMETKTIRSFVGVPINLEEENFGVLYVCGQRRAQFNDYHVDILKNLANQVSIAIGRPHQFLKVAQEIDDAISELSRRKSILDCFCIGIKDKFDFGYVTASLVHFEENVVETVTGLQFGKKWAGLSKHPLLRDEDMPIKGHSNEDSGHQKAWRDIQADIVLSDPPRAEIISGWDNRFDWWIYKEFGHDNIVRITTPIILLLDQRGNVVEEWPDNYEWKVVEDVMKQTDKGPRQHTVLELQTKDTASDENKQYYRRTIGTVGAGYYIKVENRKDKNRIEPEEAIALNQYIAGNISKIHKILLISVLQKIVERSTKFSLAESASLHFAYNHNTNEYSYEVCSGKIGMDFLENCKPRKNGLGSKALSIGKEQVIPMPDSSPKNNAEISDEKLKYGIKAEVVFPITVGDKKGLLYVYFHRDHSLTENEKKWLRFFADKAKEAIEHATNYTESNRRTLLLRTLNKISTYLSQKTAFEKSLLPFIANSTRNLLAADLVIIYEYDRSFNKFKTAPEISGILYEVIDGRSPVTAKSSPMLLIAEQDPVYVEDVKKNPIFFSDSRRKNFDSPLFVEREKIKSAAGIILQSDEEILGVMFVNYRRFHKFADQEKEIIETLAASTALAIKNQRSLKDRQDELMALAHDYKGSLLPIIGHLYNMKEHKLPDEIKEDFEYALNFAEILSVSSLSTYKWLSQRAGIDKFGGIGRFDAVAELEKFTKMLKFIKEPKNLNFDFVKETSLPEKLVNEEIFKIVMYNLLENAFKYADPNSTIRISLRFDETDHKLEIRITSVGMPIQPEEKEKIFQKFKRGEALLGRGKDGTGFGLWSARKFLRSVGGNIYLEQPDPPTTNEFVVTIPQHIPKSQKLGLKSSKDKVGPI